MYYDDREYLDGLVEATCRLFSNANRRDAHYTEIADEYHERVISGETYNAVRLRLGKIQSLLRVDRDITTIIVSRVYYGIAVDFNTVVGRVLRPRQRPSPEEIEATSIEDRKKYICFGQARAGHGLYRPIDTDDPLFLIA